MKSKIVTRIACIAIIAMVIVGIVFSVADTSVLILWGVAGIIFVLLI